MKIKVEDLKRVLTWIEQNTREVQVNIEKDIDGRNMIITCIDKYQTSVEIKLFNEGAMGPRIKKEDSLP